MANNAGQEIIGIAAVSRNGMIGLNGNLPWDIPEEAAYFEKMVEGSAMVVGRRTYDTMGRDFPNIFVVSRQAEIPLRPGFNYVPSVKEGIQAALATGKNVFIIGGAPIYEAAIPHYDRFYLTRIEDDYVGDTPLPASIPFSSWRVLNKNQKDLFDRVRGQYRACQFFEYICTDVKSAPYD